MRKMICVLFLLLAPSAFAGAAVIPHGPLISYNNMGTTLVGLATPSLGATDSEVWHSSMEVGAQTPLHIHDLQEILILTAGMLEVTVDGIPSIGSAPCTIILPPNKQHMLKNVGTIPTSQFVVISS